MEKKPVILSMYECTNKSVVFCCQKCMNDICVEALNIEYRNSETIKQQSCMHALVCYLLFPNIKLYEITNEAFVEVLKVDKNYLAYINIPDTKYGIVYGNGKTVRTKCYTCLGGDC